MKKVIVFLFLTGFVSLSYAQKSDESKKVPDIVKTAFAKAYPNAKDVKWGKEGKNEFESEFKIGNEEKSALFDNTGKWINTETEIENENLPAEVQSSIKKEFPDYKIDEAEMIETPDGMKSYEVKIKKGSSKKEIEFSADGKITKTY